MSVGKQVAVPRPNLERDGQVIPIRPGAPQSYSNPFEPKQPNFWKRPPDHAFKELPLIFEHHQDTWPIVDGAITALELGDFTQASLLWDAMMMDSRLSAVMETRVDALLSNEVELIVPGLTEGEEPEGLQAEVNADILANWPRMFPRASLASLHRWGLGISVGLGEMLWQTVDGSPQPQLKVWHPQNLYWRPDTKAFYLITWDGIVELAPGNGQWLLYAPYRNHYGFAEPNLLRTCNRTWLVRNFAWRDLARWGEVYSQGVKLLKGPETRAQSPDKTTIISAAKNLSSEPLIFLPQPDKKEETGWDLSLMPVHEGTGAQTIIETIKECNSDMAIRVLGNNLPTENKGGSLAATKQHHSDMQRGRILADDSRLCEFIRDQALRPYVLYKYGSGAVAPLPHFKVEPPDDMESRSTVFLSLAQGLVAMTTAGAPVDKRALLERFDVPTIVVTDAEGNEIVDPAPKPKPDQPGAAPVEPAPGEGPENAEVRSDTDGQGDASPSNKTAPKQPGAKPTNEAPSAAPQKVKRKKTHDVGDPSAIPQHEDDESKNEGVTLPDTDTQPKRARKPR